MQKRIRDCAHAWWDKRVIRYFRHNFDKIEYKNLRSVYIALCEIDSDFNENMIIKNFVQTVATYAGMHKDTVGPVIKKLEKIGLVGRFQENKEDGTWGHTKFELYIWEDSIGLYEEKPLTEKPGDGKNVPFKNNTKVLSNNKKNNTPLNPPVEDDQNSPRQRVKPIPSKSIPKQTSPKKLESFISMFPKEVRTNPTFRESWYDFEAMRRRIKHPVTEDAAKRIVNKMKGFTIEEQIAALDYSIEAEYRGVFPKKQFSSKGSKQNRSGNNSRFTDSGGIRCQDKSKYDSCGG